VAPDDLSRDFVASVNETAVQRDFHAMETDDGVSHHVEAFLATMEDRAAGAIADMLAGRFLPSREGRVNISVFVATQWLRGCDMREAMELPMAHATQCC
jgi:hypothetical protein